MFRRILVPLDGSPFAEAALATAYTLAGHSEGEVRLIYVLEPLPGETNFMAFESPDRTWAEEYLAETCESAPEGTKGRVTTSLRDGFATGGIVAEAQEWGADVIVMATHGRGGLSRTWMGSVADRCIRSATCPVLAIRAQEAGASTSLARNRVVVPLDGSALAEAALPYGTTLAKRLGVPLVLLEALIQAPFVDPAYIPETMNRGQQASEYLKKHLVRLRREGVDATEEVVSDKAAAHAILACAEGDLVVMSTHGRTGVERAFFGSVADKVIRGATGAVLVIPAPRSAGVDGITPPADAARAPVSRQW